MRVWGVSPTTSAVQGLVRLLEREEWRSHPEGERIGRLLIPLLDSPDETERMLVTRALPHLASDDEFWRELSRRLSYEQSADVIDALLLAAARRGSQDPTALDECLDTAASGPAVARLLGADEDTSKPLNERSSAVGDLLLQILVYLAFQHATPFASGVFATWMQEPLRRPASLDRLITWTRPYLNPQQRTNVAAQERAFQMLTNLVDASALAIHSAEETLTRSGSLTSDERLDLESAGRIADCIARDLFHASGAFRPTGPTAQTDKRAASRGFCELAFPIMESLARMPSAAAAHYLVQILTFLSPLEPRRAFLTVADIVTTNEARYEPMGETAVLDMVDTYLAERRDLVLSDPTCLTALRRILDAFVDIDSDRAIHRVQELSEIFV